MDQFAQQQSDLFSPKTKPEPPIEELKPTHFTFVKQPAHKQNISMWLLLSVPFRLSDSIECWSFFNIWNIFFFFFLFALHSLEVITLGKSMRIRMTKTTEPQNRKTWKRVSHWLWVRRLCLLFWILITVCCLFFFFSPSFWVWFNIVVYVFLWAYFNWKFGNHWCRIKVINDYEYTKRSL